MKVLLTNIAAIIIAFVIQTGIFPFIPFLSATPNFMLILSFSYSFMYGKKEGLLYGFVAGLLMDLFYSGPFGFFTLIFIWIGYVNGSLARFFYEDYISLPLVMCAGNEIAYHTFIYIFRFFIRGKLDIWYYMKNIVIPEMIITLLFTLLLYRGLLEYNRRLKSL